MTWPPPWHNAIKHSQSAKQSPPGISWQSRQMKPTSSPSLQGDQLKCRIRPQALCRGPSTKFVHYMQARPPWNFSSFTNDFSHRDPGGFGEIHLMFPLTAMLNHSCFPNIARWKVLNKTTENCTFCVYWIIEHLKKLLSYSEPLFQIFFWGQCGDLPRVDFSWGLLPLGQ